MNQCGQILVVMNLPNLDVCTTFPNMYVVAVRSPESRSRVIPSTDLDIDVSRDQILRVGDFIDLYYVTCAGVKSVRIIISKKGRSRGFRAL